MAGRGWLGAMVGSMVFWGLANPFSDIAMDELSPAQTYGIEVTTGLASFLVIVLLTPSLRARAHNIDWRLAAPLGLVMPGLCFYLGNVGYMFASVTTGVILLSTEAIFTALGGVWALGEKLPVRSIVAIALGIAGVVVVGVNGQSSEVSAIGRTYGVLGIQIPATVVGAVAFIVSAVFSAAFAVAVRKYAATTDLIGLTVGQLAAAFGLAAAMWVGMRIDIHEAMSHRTSFTAAMISGVLGSAIAFLIFNVASEHVQARQTALTLNLIPVIAIALGALLGRGLPSSIQLAGSAVVLVSLFFLESDEIAA